MVRVNLSIIRLGFGLELQFCVKAGKKTSSHISVKKNLVTQHTSINKLPPCHGYVLKRWAWQPLRYKGGKYDIKVVDFVNNDYGVYVFLR